MKRISMLFILLLAVSTAFAQLNLKIMSYNVRNGKGMDGVHNLQRVADVINSAKADIVAVQELDSMTNRSGKKYVLGEIAALTNMHPEYFPAIEFNGGKYGIGILYKKKPISVKGYNLPGREEKRGILVAEFNQFLFACTHLSLAEEDRMASLEIIGKIAKESKKPFYLAGDLNAVPNSLFIKELEKDFEILSNSKEFTFPADVPNRTLDYIAVWKGNAPRYREVAAQVVEEGMASDHRPIVADLKMAFQEGECKDYKCEIDGIERSYKLYLPNNIKPGAPLVIVLHGYGAIPEHVENKGFGAAADKYGFAVCYPLGTNDGRGNPCWNVGYPFQEDMKVDDVSFLCKLAKKLQKEHNLSKKNTFCSGMSNGGEMCYLLAFCGQKTFKAVAPIAGLTMAWMPLAYGSSRAIPLFEIHGTEDRVSEWTGDMENKGGWGEYLSVPDAVNYWVSNNGCYNAEVGEMPLRYPDSHKVITHKDSGANKTPKVWLYEVVGGVHSWFNEDMDTADEVWKFFEQYLF